MQKGKALLFLNCKVLNANYGLYDGWFGTKRGKEKLGMENSLLLCCIKGRRAIFVRRPPIGDSPILAKKGISPCFLQSATVSGNKHQLLVDTKPNQLLAKLKHNSVHSLLIKKCKGKTPPLFTPRKHYSPLFFRFSFKMRRRAE